MIALVVILWILFNLLLFIFVIHEFVLLGFAVFKKKEKTEAPALPQPLPKVAIQLPVYNEKFVIQRLLETAVKIDYPTDLLEIQVLDDSTDETTSIIEDFIANQPEDTPQISHIRREDRSGFKAGALAHGMQASTAEFFAVFDADFIPDQVFLYKTLPYFADDKVGTVQTRWTHINENFSLITRAQSVMLDAHFGIEQKGRSNAGGFINFNGTAGIWRRTCIEEVGGWQADTLTEDLDLSFRAQALNWKINYRFQTESPSELPLTFNAFRNQQFRWSKGAAECLRKNFSLLWRANVPFSSKLIGTFHLLNSSIYMLVLGLMLLAPVIYFLQVNAFADSHWLLKDVVPIIGLVINILLILIFLGGKLICSRNKLRALQWFLPSLFLFFSMTLGISVHMVLGVIAGYRGKKTAFVRTPKFGKNAKRAFQKRNNYGFKSHFNLKIIEGLLMLYGAFWIYEGIREMNALMITYSLIILSGFSIALFFGNSTFKIGK